MDATAAIRALEAQASVHHTPCGDGHITWHRWNPGSNTATTHQPPVLLLHGGSGSWTHWLRNIASLVATGREVWVPDLPGFGDSALSPLGMDADAEHTPLEAGLQQLLGAQAVDMVGFSFGAMVGGFWAQSYPARVGRLVLVGAPGLWDAKHNVLRLKGWRHLVDPIEVAAAHRFNIAALMLHDPLAINAEVMALHTANVQRDRIPGRRLSYTDVLARTLQRVQCPVHAIYGQQDALYIGRLNELAEVLQAAPTFGQLHLVEQAGHWVQYERAEAFNQQLLSILDAGPA